MKDNHILPDAALPHYRVGRSMGEVALHEIAAAEQHGVLTHRLPAVKARPSQSP